MIFRTKRPLALRVGIEEVTSATPVLAVVLALPLALETSGRPRALAVSVKFVDQALVKLCLVDVDADPVRLLATAVKNELLGALFVLRFTV